MKNKILCLLYPDQDRITNFEKIVDGVRIEIRSDKRVVAYTVLDRNQVERLKLWLRDQGT